MYYLGLDGGGTKTRYILIDEELKVVYDLERGTVHIRQIGEESLKEELQFSLNMICTKANINYKDIKYAFLGMPGYGESKEDMNSIKRAVNEVFNGIKYAIGNDSIAGWAAGTGCSPGINIVSGTGSIAYGRNESGQEARCGGWGPSIGDDGSAYWIALRIINEYTKQKDGRKPKTILLDILEKECNIKDYFEIVDIIFNKLKFSRSEIASFSKIGALAANEGCSECKKIFEEAAENLFLHVKTLVNKLNLYDNFILSYTGGVFKSGDLILNPILKAIKNNNINCTIQKPQLEPWHGAALMAYSLDGNKIPKDYKDRLENI